MFKVDLKFDKNNNFTDLLPPRAKKKKCKLDGVKSRRSQVPFIVCLRVLKGVCVPLWEV